MKSDYLTMTVAGTQSVLTNAITLKNLSALLFMRLKQIAQASSLYFEISMGVGER